MDPDQLITLLLKTASFWEALCRPPTATNNKSKSAIGRPKLWLHPYQKCDGDKSNVATKMLRLQFDAARWDGKKESGSFQATLNGVDQGLQEKGT